MSSVKPWEGVVMAKKEKDVKDEYPMELMVHNTLAGKKESFEPLEEGRITMYVCGVTVYDECHVGHARALVVFDVIRRFLEHLG